MNSLDLLSKHINGVNPSNDYFEANIKNSHSSSDLSYNNDNQLNFLSINNQNNSANELIESLDLIPHNYIHMEQLFSNQSINQYVNQDNGLLFANINNMNSDSYFNGNDINRQFIEMNKIQNSPLNFLNFNTQPFKPMVNPYNDKWNTINPTFNYKLASQFNAKTTNMFPRNINHNNWVTKTHPKPVFSYSCLIALALKNSQSGCLPVSEIYKYMQEKFPYFKTAPDGWKNSVRHNLSLNKAFCKVERSDCSTAQRKGCLWSLKPEKQKVVDKEIRKWIKKHPDAIKSSMSNPDEFLFAKDLGDDSTDEVNGESSDTSAQIISNDNSDKTEPTSQNIMNELLNDLSNQNNNWPIFMKNDPNDPCFNFSNLIESNDQFFLQNNDCSKVNRDEDKFFDNFVNE